MTIARTAAVRRMGWAAPWLAAAAIIFGGLPGTREAQAQVQPGVGIVQQPVGGVFVDADGVVANAEADALGKLQQVRKSMLQQVPGDLHAPAELRKVSLRRLDAAIAEHLASGKPLPDEIQYLAGLQRIQYVLVYPDQ